MLGLTFRAVPLHFVLAVAASLLLTSCSLSCGKQPERTSIRQLSGTDAIRIYDVHIPSSAIGGILWYRMLLPTPSAGEKLPVLYLLPGANSGPADVMEHSEIAKLATEKRLAVVIPDGKLSYYTNALHRPHARWEDAIVQDLMPDVLNRFPVSSERAHTGIAGISMGGYGAAMLTFKHPALYGFTAIVSGALDIARRAPSLRRPGQTWRIWTTFGFRPETRHSEDVFAMLDKYHQRPQAAWFISCGGKDPLYGANERFARRMRQQGVELRLLTTSDGHNWQSWNEALPKMFDRAGSALTKSKATGEHRAG
jgi:putative tributyrin esterase